MNTSQEDLNMQWLRLLLLSNQASQQDQEKQLPLKVFI
jgi:hypothetical protein